ncbi:MAG: VIT1/CCC1 transporter family protein [Candidatus Nanohaloarchaea archaeon]
MLKERLRPYIVALGKEEVRSISRRYFISNGFDGTLTSIGIAIGSYLSGVPSGLTVFKVALGAAVGLATSGVWSVWEIERAETKAEMKEIEEAMLTDLEGTKLQEGKNAGRVVNAVMSGIGPTFGIILPAIPFLFEGTVLNMMQATLFAVGIGVLDLFLFGAYMADISGQRWYIAGLRMGLAGIAVAVINILLPG